MWCSQCQSLKIFVFPLHVLYNDKMIRDGNFVDTWKTRSQVMYSKQNVCRTQIFF